MNLFDQFLATQGRMAQNEGQELINRANLQKITEAERAQKMQADTLAFYQKQAAPTTTLANLSEMKETPDAGMESQGLRQMTPEAGGAPKMKSPAQTLLDAANEAGKAAKELMAINPKEAENQRKERDNLLTKAAPLLKEERLAELADAEQVQQWVGSVKNPQSFQIVMGQIAQKHPDWLKMKDPQGNQLFPRNLDGSFAYGPAQQAVVQAMGDQSIKKIDALKLQGTIDDNIRADKELERKQKADAEQVRANKAREANAREGLKIRQEAAENKIEVKETTTETTEARRLRKEVETKVKPLDEVQRNITQAKALIAIGNEAADVQLNARLTDIFDKSRATNMLFTANKNFGSVAGRIEQHIGRFFTGKYSDSNRAKIYEMITEMENMVLKPSRQKINDHYGKIAEKSGVKKDLVVDPDFYASTPAAGTQTAPVNPEVEADDFIKMLTRGKS